MKDQIKDKRLRDVYCLLTEGMEYDWEWRITVRCTVQGEQYLWVYQNVHPTSEFPWEEVEDQYNEVQEILACFGLLLIDSYLDHDGFGGKVAQVVEHLYPKNDIPLPPLCESYAYNVYQPIYRKKVNDGD
jgi:hypothetical protein